MIVDLSHTIEAGMITFKGLPGPIICDYLSREESRKFYEPGTEFQIGRIEMVANTGTYLDSPFHRYADGHDLSELLLTQLAHLPGVVINAPFERALAVDTDAFAGVDLAGRAVLVHTGWDRFWRTETYFEHHPFVTEAAARYLAEAGATFVGIDSHNIDDTRGRSRPVHTILLGRQIPICEHMCNLGALPADGFLLHAVPPRIKGVGTFPVRAYAVLERAPAGA